MAITGVHRHRNQGRIVRSFERPDAKTLEAVGECYSAFVLDHVGKLGAMLPALLPLASGMRVCGPATTCEGPDLSIRRMAINLARPGDVLVVAAGGSTDYSCFGDGTAKKMMLKGMAGAVIDGSVRDAGGIRALGFPTFAKGVTPKNYHYPVSAEYCGVNVPVVCAGVLVHPGDIILGDDDGIVVLEREAAAELAEKLLKNIREERAEREALTEFVAFDVEQELKDRGYRFE